MILALLLGLAALGGTASAQGITTQNIFDPPQDEADDLFTDPTPNLPTEERERVVDASGATLRSLDKTTGEVRDLDVAVGETAAFGRIQVTLGECRYPEANPSGNAYAYVVIREAGREESDFQGWMVAASPALNALEHPRYDVWVMRCST